MLVLLAYLSGCKHDDDNTPQGTGYDSGTSLDRDFYGLVLDTGGAPVPNATVSIGNVFTQTSDHGLFVIKGALVKEKFAFIKVTKSGFIDGSRVVIPTNGNNRIDIMLIPDIATKVINSGTISTVSLLDGTEVEFDGVFQDVQGGVYSGPVNVCLFHLKPSDTYFQQTMPGTLLAIDKNNYSKILETFGMIHVELTGSSGQELNIASGHTAEIRIPIDPSQTAIASSSIPLWYFDENDGMWKEEGTAAKTGNTYIGKVSHFSWWNLDHPFDYCYLSTSIINTASLPVSNAIVELVRSNGDRAWAYSDNIGNVAGLIYANEVLTLNVYNSCMVPVHSLTIGPFASLSNNNILPITINSTITTTTFTGTLLDCSGSNVINGFVALSPYSANNNFFYSYIQQPVSNGSFSFTTMFCGASQQFTCFGEDFTTMMSSGNSIFTVTGPSTNIGNLYTCNQQIEYITLQIDTNPVKVFIANIDADGSNGLKIQAWDVNSAISIITYLSSINYGSIYTTNDFTSEFNDGIIASFVTINSTNTVQFVVSNVGNVGGYIDMTMNGPFTDSNGISHTLTSTVHVLRDN